jgi:hypothetical protein
VQNVVHTVEFVEEVRVEVAVGVGDNAEGGQDGFWVSSLGLAVPRSGEGAGIRACQTGYGGGENVMRYENLEMSDGVAICGIPRNRGVQGVSRQRSQRPTRQRTNEKGPDGGAGSFG